MTKQLSIFAMLALTATTVTAQDANNAKGVAFFEKKIRPVLVQHCYKCHAADSKSVRGGLLLDTRSGTRKGGDSGPAVVPHKLDESLLIESLRYDGYEMPPSGKLPDAVIRDFEKWIEMGAPDPRDGESIATSDGGMDLEAGREFWAFKPPIDHPAPKVRNGSWPSSDIDRFVLSKIEQNDMEPAGDADKRTLLRRVYFDLIGLPPSPADIDAFLKDPSDHAFESVVDELLASRHFGERWGRHWLDVARYSDSTGGGRSLLFKVSWRYRNYVIDAFNRGTPFDQFIIDQIAGDLIPDQDDEQRARSLTATGFLALGPTNYENQDKRQLRMDVVDEQIDTIGRAFLGMTIGCARCHDHKFDPIPTSDYYALAGIFRSTRSLIDGNVSKWITRPLPTSGVDPELGRKIAEAEKRLKANQKRIRKLEKRTIAVTIDDTEAELSGKWTESTFVKGFVGKRYVHSVDPAAKAIYTFAPTKSGRHELFASYTHGTNRAAAAPISVVQGKAEIGSKNLDQRPVPDNQFVSLGEFDLVSAEPVHVTVRPVGAPQVVIADAIRLEFIGDEKQQTTRRELNDARSKVATLKQQLVTLRKAENDAANVLSVDEERQPEDFHICIRGNVRNLGEKVPRGFLTVATNKPIAIPENVSGRLEFAKWIASSSNPLTARVAVNRIWHHLFGSGLVRTVDNFGVPGERPSHPELLDHLAATFVRGGWSTRKLIRAIVLSRTYRQSSRAASETMTLDPENRLFARQNLRRLQAESLRDSLFAISGQLDLSPGDDTVRKGTTTEYGYQFSSKRRSVYLPVFRNQLHPMFAVFDFPDPNLSNGRRTVSTLSTQALYLMNSPLVQQHAAETAKRILAASEPSESQRVRLLYETVVGREPTDAESQLASDFLQDVGGDARVERWTALCHALIGSVDFRYIR